MTGCGGVADGVMQEADPQCPKCGEKGVSVGAGDDPSRCPKCKHTWKAGPGKVIVGAESFERKISKALGLPSA